MISDPSDLSNEYAIILPLKKNYLPKNGNNFEYLAQELRRLPSLENDYTMGVVRFGLFDNIEPRWLLKTLDRSSKNYHGSKDLLNFGFHVHAVKER